MMKEKIKNQIIDIDGYVHVINGKVICFKPDVYDLDNPEDVQNVLDTVVSLFGSDSKLQVWFDDNTFVVLERSNAGNVVVGMGDVLCLPEDVQKKCKLAIFKQKNQIVDIDGYIHVINGRVICFKPDIYDLNNLDDVEYLCEWVLNMRTDAYLRKKYTDDTFVSVRESLDGSHNIITSGSIEVYFKSIPEDVKKKVRSVIAEYQSKAGN